MIKKLVLVFIAIFAISTYGQEGTISPDSFYGIGSLKFKGSVENRIVGRSSVCKEFKMQTVLLLPLKLSTEADFHFKNSSLYIENESINEFGISFGVGLPVGSFFSNASLGMELGKRGTTNSNLIQENFINFQISLSLNDRWFQKENMTNSVTLLS